jgi:hypothetical protein
MHERHGTWCGMALQFTTSYLDDVRSLFSMYKRGAEAAMAQVSDADLTATLDPEMNSIALIVRPMARSRTAIATASSRRRPRRVPT